MALHLEMLHCVFLRIGIFSYITIVSLSTSLFYTYNTFIQSTNPVPILSVDIIMPFIAFSLNPTSFKTGSSQEQILHLVAMIL